MQTNFPKEKSTFLVHTKTGVIEVSTAWAENARSLVAVICHPHPSFGGTMNNKVVTTLARVYQHLGVPTVRFNFRGVGKSDGRHGEGIGEQHDLLAIIRWLRRVLPNHTLCLAGFSFGSFVSAAIANKIKVHHLVSIAPPVHHYDYSHFNKISCPWLVVQGDQDEIVPFKNVQQWVENKGIDFVMMPEVGHFFHGKLIELRNLLVEKLQPMIENS